MNRLADPIARARSRNAGTAAILASIALVFFAGVIASRWFGGYDVGLTVVGGAVFLYLLLAIGRNLRGK